MSIPARPMKIGDVWYSAAERAWYKFTLDGPALLDPQPPPPQAVAIEDAAMLVGGLRPRVDVLA